MKCNAVVVLALLFSTSLEQPPCHRRRGPGISVDLDSESENVSGPFLKAEY
jgi:hypothetical protein